MERQERLGQNANLTSKSVPIVEKILSQNDMKANELRVRYRELGLYVINLMSSPGSGKTTFLEALARAKDLKFCVLEGDLQTNRDAQRLQNLGVSAYQITTGSACHLDAQMIGEALSCLEAQCDMGDMEYLFIENVGNLVCPASYDVGAALNIVLLSTPEGDDKILKYPTMFLCADVVVVSKADLMEHFNFSLERVRADLGALNARAEVLLLSSKDEELLSQVSAYIKQKKARNYQSNHQF